MNYKSRFLIAAVMIFTAVLLSSCSKNPMEEYNSLKDKAGKGETVDEGELRKAFHKAYGSAVIPQKNCFIGENFVASLQENEFKIVYPANCTIDIDKVNINGLKYGFMNDRFIVLGNLNRISVFSNKGKYITSFEDDKSDIKSLQLYFDEILRFDGEKIDVYDLKTETISALTSENFLPPYKKYYKSQILVKDRKISILTGIAGSYYLSVLDIETGKTLIKNIAVSSSSFYVKNNSVYCVKGGSGSWKIYEYDIATKQKKEFRQLNNIENLFFNEDLIFIKKESGVKIYSYDNLEIKMDIKPDILGIIRDGLVLRENKKLYVVLNKRFLKKNTD